MNMVVEPTAPCVSLFDIVPDSDLKDFRFAEYFKGEREILTPALQHAGYTLEGAFFSGERDTWGPLSRCIYAVKDGERVCLVYG